jgi:hypothetical protein
LGKCNCDNNNNNNKPTIKTLTIITTSQAPVIKPAEPRKPIIITKNVDKNSDLYCFYGVSFFFM